MTVVSTLICTYNAKGFFSKTIDSVINQTYKNQEILIRDDWSTDGTVKILEQYAKKDKRINIYTFQQEWKKLWPYWGLNFLLNKAKWKYIAIQDHDDIWHPEKIKKQINFLEKNSKYIWCWSGTLMYFWKSELWYIVDNIEKDKNYCIHTSLVFRNQGFKYNDKNVFLWDIYFMKYILTQTNKNIKIIPEILNLHYYKENNNNFSELRFKINKKNISRYLNIYWINFISFIKLLYIIVSKFLPRNLKKYITFNISLKNKIKSKTKLMKDNNIKKMLKYF